MTPEDIELAHNFRANNQPPSYIAWILGKSVSEVEAIFKKPGKKKDQQTEHIADYIKDACRKYQIRPGLLLGPSREAAIVSARQEAMAACVASRQWSLTQIGMAFNRHHTTVMHAARKWGVA